MTDIAIENKPTLYDRYLAIIKSYLNQSNTDSAILINGEWGSGKTFFIKGELNDLIAKELKKEIIYLSLFGISSVEDLRNELVSKCVKIGIKVPSTVKKVFNESFEWLTGKKAENIFGSVYIDSLDLSNKVLIFDDLERCETKLNEILGFVNEQIEHKKTKVILIADENNIKKEFQEEYYRRKEKLISRTIKFETDLGLLYDKIIASYEKENESYFSFLQKQQNTIVTMCNEFELHNLRTFSFALGILKEVYEACKDIERYPQESIETIILFVLSMSIEFKSGNISNNDKKDFSNEIVNITFSDSVFRKLKMFTQDKEDETKIEQTKTQKYREKYLNNQKYKYYYFDSIFNFIVNGYFDENKYSSELSKFLPFEKSEQDKIYDYFSNIRLYDLNDIDFNDRIDIFLGYIERGDYVYYQYYHILLSLIRFNFIMSDYAFYEKTKLGFEKSKSKLSSFSNINDFQNIESLHDRLRNFDNIDDIRLENMYNLIKEHHFKAIENKSKEMSVDMLNVLKNTIYFDDFSNYIAELGTSFNILSMVNSNNFVKLLPEIDNKKIVNFFFTLRDKQPSDGKKLSYECLYNLLSLRNNLRIYLQKLPENMPIRRNFISSIAIPIVDNIVKRKDTELYLKLLAYSIQFRQTFHHLQDKKLHLQASYALDTEWFVMQFRFVEQTTSDELEAVEIDLEAILAEENITKEAFLQEVQQDKKIIFYDIETLYIFASPTLERWTPEYATQDARDVLGIMLGSLPNYSQAA